MSNASAHESDSETQFSQAEICTYLRGKNGLGRLEGGENPWQHIDKVTTSFTCLCTGEPFGPDYELADLARCSRERSCCIIAPA